MAAAAAVAQDIYPIRVFSQRGATCGTDALFTILFEADPIGAYFTDLIAAGGKSLTKKHDEMAIALGYAIMRYKKMHALPRTPYGFMSLPRMNSANTGEGSAVLTCITGSDSFGITETQISEALDQIITHDVYDILPHGVFSYAHVPSPTLDPAILKLDRVFAAVIILARFVKQPYYLPANFRNNNNKPNNNNYGFFPPDAEMVSSGHVVGILKYKGDWYFTDNEVGWLHKFADPAFVESYMLPALLEMQRMKWDAPDKHTAIMNDEKQVKKYGLIKFVVKEDNFSKYGIPFVIVAGDHAYAGSPDDFDSTDSHYLVSNAWLLMARPKAGGSRRKTRRHRRASRRAAHKK